MSAQKTLVAATTNEHKIAEIAAIVGTFGYRVVSREEAGVPDFEVEEYGTTFEENSLIKAREIFNYFNSGADADESGDEKVAVISDDSGLEVSALDGAPGVYSARFANSLEDAADFIAADEDVGQLHRSRQDRANNAKLLRLLEGVPRDQRDAKFVSVITCILPDNSEIVCRGEVCGHIDFAETGTAGFGYDPLFIPEGFEHSFGIFEAKDKNAISHRGKALRKLTEKLADEYRADPL